MGVENDPLLVSKQRRLTTVCWKTSARQLRSFETGRRAIYEFNMKEIGIQVNSLLK